MPAHGSPVPRGPRNSNDHMATHTTPRRLVTKEEITYDVEKIVGELKTCATEMEKMNTEIVKDALEDIVERPIEQRHMSSIDPFADMPSIAEEPGSASDGAIQIKFRVSKPNFRGPLLSHN